MVEGKKTFFNLYFNLILKIVIHVSTNRRFYIFVGLFNRVVLKSFDPLLLM